MYQFSPKTGKILTYEIYTYSKHVYVVKNCITSLKEKIACVCWMKNGNLLVGDIFHNLYIISSDGKKIQIILCGDSSISAGDENLIMPFSNGFVKISDKSLFTYYHKPVLDTNINEHWNAAWSIRSASFPLKLALARHKEAILFYTDDRKAFELTVQDNKPKIEQLFSQCYTFKFMCLLKPEETYCALVNIANTLTVCNIFNGKMISSFQINPEDQVLCMVSHPRIPLLAISTSSGKCFCFAVNMGNINPVAVFSLQKYPLQKINFSKNGYFLGIASAIPSSIFLLQVIINKDIKIVHHLILKKSLINFLIYEDQESLQLLILFKTFSTAPVGNYIEIFSINDSGILLHNHRKIFMNDCYQNVEYCYSDYDFLGLPYLSKQLHFFKFKNNYESIVLTDAIHSEHKLRKFNVNISQNYIVSSGLDGFVILRNISDPSKFTNIFIVHHYNEKGTECSISSNCGAVIVSLGRNGSLVCFKYKFNQDDEYQKKKQLIIDNNIGWTCKTIDEFQVCERETWLEEEEKRIILAKTNNFLSIRSSIFAELKKLKIKIKSLINFNDSKCSETRLSLAQFDLNNKIREDITHSALNKQKQQRILLQGKLRRNEKVIEYLMQNFWNLLSVRDEVLISFDCKNCVNNYSMRCLNNLEQMDDFSIEMFSTPSLNSYFKLFKNTDKGFSDLSPVIDTFSNSLNVLNNFRKLENSNNIIFTSSTSYKWIKGDISSRQLSNRVSDSSTMDLISTRENKLKIHFNKKFDEFKALKEKVLQEITSRLQRLRKCTNELKNIFGIVSNDDKFEKLNWHPLEIFQNITAVMEEDISFEIPSTVAINTKKEKISYDSEPAEPPIDNSLHGGAILNNPEMNFTFQKKKLEEIMDGLLEIRWEDEIQKEIPKPECLTFKNSLEYEKQDLEAIKVYEQKVRKLEVDRQKYKDYLESEICSLKDQIQIDVRQFDKKMEVFALEKIKIQSAILQEFLLRLNRQKYQLLKDHSMNKISSIHKNDLLSLSNEQKTLIQELSNIESKLIDLKNKYEILNKRNKILDSRFRSEFEELKQPMVEHLLRQFRKRPQICQITYISLVCLIEMHESIISGKKSAILPIEYLDFLTKMDTLDIMPNNLPPQIDTAHWKSLCKLRRNKIEIEVKLRISSLELAEAEQTYFNLQKLNSSLQSKIYRLTNNLEDERFKQSNLLQNTKIQVVLTTAQIEVQISGCISDLENSTVVNCNQLININNEILGEGKKKIIAMQTLIKLKKSIITKDWKFQCMTKKLKHLKNHFIALTKTKIGKEMQKYLVEKLDNKFRYRDVACCDKILKSVEKKFQRMLKKEKTGLLRVTAEINYWCKLNAALITEVDKLALKKQEESFRLKEDHLQKRNEEFRKNYFRLVMQRTKFAEEVKKSRNNLLSLQIQLELLKLKTYPTLRFKDVCYFKRNIYSKIYN